MEIRDTRGETNMQLNLHKTQAKQLQENDLYIKLFWRLYDENSMEDRFPCLERDSYRPLQISVGISI